MRARVCIGNWPLFSVWLYDDYYGIDWDGPIPVSDEPEYVVVDNLPSLLSDDENDLLTQQLPPSQDILEEGWMILLRSLDCIMT